MLKLNLFNKKILYQKNINKAINLKGYELESIKLLLISKLYNLQPRKSK